jgi:RNA polymerase sigma factor (sigma-70 family)
MKHEFSVNLELKSQKDDVFCFEKIVLSYKDKVSAYIRHYIRDMALVEDILQDTFIKVFQAVKAGKYSENGKFISWVMCIAHNLIIDHFRMIKQMNTISNDDFESDLFNLKRFTEENIEDEMIRLQIHQDIRKMISHLDVDQKEVIILKYYAGLSFKEIAKITKVSINTALGRMRYALINMRRIMEENKISLTFS